MLRKPQLAALVLAFALPLAAQQVGTSEIQDPANLMGERVSPPALADTLAIDHGAPALEQLLRKLRTRASMMLIVAHPDDEDGGLLTLESRGMGARVAMLTLTRGEGGQNLMTGDFNDALGLIRTQELLAEDRYTGTDQFFGTEVDFGFSKTKEESFKQWTHERVLYDAVRAVRLYRPLVLASVFIGGVTDGHGQHQVSGEITQEVFLAAADPKVFPEMGLPPWAPLRVYARVPFAPITEKGMFDYATGKYLPPHFHNYVTGTDSTTPPQATVTIHEGDVPNIPAFEGRSYVQWARQGLALQKTQIGPNVRIPPAGRVDVGYTLYGTRIPCAPTQPPSGCPILGTASSSPGWASAKPTALPAPTEKSSGDQDLFTGIDTSLRGLISLAPDASKNVKLMLWVNLGALEDSVAEAQREFDPAHPEKSISVLHNALASYDGFVRNVEEMKPPYLPADEKFNLLHELRIKHVQLNDALVLAHGLTLTAVLGESGRGASVPSSILISDRYLSVTTTESNQSDRAVVREGLEIAPVSSEKSIFLDEAADLPGGSSSITVLNRKIGHPVPEYRPYFSRKNIEQPYYDVSNPALRNAPATPPSLIVQDTLGDQELDLTLAAIVQGPEIGQVKQASAAVPPISVAVTPQAGLVTPSFLAAAIDSTLLSNLRQASGTLTVLPVKGWDTSDTRLFAIPYSGESFHDILVAKPYEYSPASLRALPKTIPAGSAYTFQLSANLDGHQYTEGYRSVGYPGLTYTNYYTPASYTATAVDVTTAPNLRIAYLPGTGDDVPDFLPSLGVTPTLLAPKDLTAENLKHYDAVILGVRAYMAHPELEGAGSAPLNEYVKQGGVVIVQYNSGGFDPASAPYPYTLPGDSAHNVVDEDQPVRLLAPENPLLTWPNKITSADFDHWIEERGHGFASEWSPEYTALLETHDPEQDPQKGGLLLAKVGKGAYIYCAFALYRQLPEGVPGAYRLLANLVSYAKNPGR